MTEVAEAVHYWFYCPLRSAMRRVDDAYAAFGQTGYVERAFWFSIQDVPEGNLFYGLVDSDGAAKPALAAYQEHAGH